MITNFEQSMETRDKIIFEIVSLFERNNLSVGMSLATLKFVEDHIRMSPAKFMPFCVKRTLPVTICSKQVGKFLKIYQFSVLFSSVLNRKRHFLLRQTRYRYGNDRPSLRME